MTEPQAGLSANALTVDSSPKGPASSQASDTMSMLDHLTELRNRLFIVLGAAGFGIALAFIYAVPIIQILKGMASPILMQASTDGKPPLVEFVQITPGEVLMASLKLSIFLGLAAASPIILYQVMRFVMPGLEGKEKWQLFWVVVAGSLLFVAGATFAYFLVVPSALGYLLEYGQQVAKTQISIAQYIDFCLSLLVLTGVVFELPLLLFFLSLIGLITSRQLISQWRQAMVGIAFAAAFLTPSQDPFTMIIVAVAMAGLYFLSVVPIRLTGR